MRTPPVSTTGRHRRGRLLGALFASASAVLLVACGVTLGSGARGSELFEKLTVTGDFTAGATLTLELRYTQIYPTSLNVVCDLLQPGKPTPTPPPSPTLGPGATPTPTPVRIPKPASTPVSRILAILDVAIDPNTTAPTVTTADEPFEHVTPIQNTLLHDFQAPERPGRYIVRCFTPIDDNNQIRKEIRIRPAS